MTLMRVTAGVGLGLATLTLVGGCGVVDSSTETHSYTVSDKVTKLVVKNASGRIDVTAGNGPIQVDEVYHFSHAAPKTRHTVDGGALKLSDDSCGLVPSKCEIDYTIRVPASLAVDITAPAGSVEVTGISGDVTVQANAGKVSGSGLGSARTEVNDNAGEVSLAYRAAPQSVNVKSNAGKVTVRLPRDADYAVNAKANLGFVTVKVPENTDSTRKITATSNAGSVQVLSD